MNSLKTTLRSLDIEKITWALFLLALPVTSFPFFPAFLGGKSSVRPLSIYPLLILLVIVTIPRLFRQPLPKTFLPLLAFIVVAVMGSLLALSYGLESLRGVTAGSRLIRGLATLGIGSAIYFTVALTPRSWEELRASLRWLYAGFGVALLWGSLQAVNILVYSPRYFEVLNRIQKFISTRKLFARRVSGLTYEPKWFAEQICFLLLPWLLSSIMLGTSVFKWRLPFKPLRWVTVEWLLLGWASVILVCTYSRTGLFILVVVSFLSLLFFRPLLKNTRQLVDESSADGSPANDQPINGSPPSERSTSGRPINGLALEQSTQKTVPVHKGLSFRRLGEALLVVLVMVSLIYFAGTQNNYFARLWTYWISEDAEGKDYLQYISFQQRFVFAETALRMFEAYPILGVGLGNYAFYFNEMLPDRPWNQQPDILRQLTFEEGQNQLITPKNVFAKILAEMGLLGFSTFLAFILAIVGCAVFLFLGPSLDEKLWGMSGLLGVMIFFIVAFSFDSFAIPNMWVVFGFITAATLKLKTPGSVLSGAGSRLPVTGSPSSGEQ